MIETPAEHAEAAAIRRRWITLGEIVAIAGLIISALALWNSYADRRADQAEKQAAQQTETKAQTAVLLTATPRHDGETLALVDPLHPIQSVTVRFPTALGLPAETSAPMPSIAARWFSTKMLTLTDGGPDSQRGRLPVLITADYWLGDRHVFDKAIYDIAWRSEGRVLRGRIMRLDGLLLRERNNASQARLDAIWEQQMPR